MEPIVIGWDSRQHGRPRSILRGSEQYEVRIELDDSGCRYSQWSGMMGVTETTPVDRD